MTNRFGKKDPTYDNRDIRYADIRPRGVTLPTVPAGWGRGRDFTDWLMLGNGPCDDNSIPSSWAAYEGAGDCTIADPCHSTMGEAHDAGRPIPKFTSLSAVTLYSTIGNLSSPGQGYNPQTGANDNGLEIRDVLNYRQSPGITDVNGNVYKIGPYVSLEPGNSQQLREACWLFDYVSIGIQVPQSAMDQSNAGQTWSVVSGMMNNIAGGHDVPVVGHPEGGLWTVITWARRQLATWGFISATCDEAWAYIDPERYSTVTGETYNGYKDADLEKYLTLVSGQTPSA